MNPGLRRTEIHSEEPAESHRDSRACSTAPATRAPDRNRRRHRSVEHRPCRRRRRRDRRRRLCHLQRARSDRGDQGPEGRGGGGRFLMTATIATNHRHPGALRRNRQDGRRVSRQLLHVVRNRPLRAAARASGAAIARWRPTGIGLPVIEAHCEYKSPARYDDELQVKTRGKLLSPARVEFALRNQPALRRHGQRDRPHRACGR